MATTRQSAAATPAAYRKSTVREYIESICIAVVLALFVRTFVVQAFKIPSGSMENNLLIGDHLLVNKFVFAPTFAGFERLLLPIDPIRRGDILVFKYPKEPERDFIKRVIGLPGETVSMRDRKIYIDGKVIDEPYVHFNSLTDPTVIASGERLNFDPVPVPPGHYFMMGDNRDNSQDSRYWGVLNREYIKGKAMFIYFSVGDGGIFSLGDKGIRWGRLLHQIH